MEHITDSFRVDTPLATTWNTLLDIERIAPCLPGAQLQEIEGDEFRGIVKVKVGPITAQYKGTAKLDTVDEASRTIKIDASGRDTRGQGNASAIITVVMRDDNGGTVVDIDTELNITGKVAQFGRGGMMVEVSSKILKQFVDNLEHDVLSTAGQAAQASAATVGAPGAASSDAAAATDDATAGAEPTVTADASKAGTAPSAPPVLRKIDAPEAKPLDLLDAAGGSVAKRALPLAALLALLLIALGLRRRK